MTRYPRVGVGGLIIRDGQVLLQLRTKAPEAEHWNIPGGKVEWGECLEEALLRELNEETGAHYTIEKLLCVIDHIVPEDDAHWVSPTFLCKIKSGEPYNAEPHKLKETRWFPLDALPSPLTITAKHAIDNYLKESR